MISSNISRDDKLTWETIPAENRQRVAALTLQMVALCEELYALCGGNHVSPWRAAKVRALVMEWRAIADEVCWLAAGGRESSGG